MKKYYINKNNVEQWKCDIQKSVMFYNNWFLDFAPATYIKAREEAIYKVENAFQKTECLNEVSAEILKTAPEIISILRMSATPPLARERLAGLAGVSKTLINALESGRVPKQIDNDTLVRVIDVITKLFDRDIMPWLERRSYPHEMDRLLAEHVIGDRVCGSLSDPLIRNEQERRQLETIKNYLTGKGYKFVESKYIAGFKTLKPGCFSFRLNVPVNVGSRKVNLPADVVVMRKNASDGDFPVLIECKSAGDFTNTNKRRKEEAAKIEQLRSTYGKDIEFILFLCGYFDSGYLGYEAAEGIDWVWEHRIEDFEKANI